MDQNIVNEIALRLHAKYTYHIDAFGLEHITELVYGKKIKMLESPNDTTHEYSIEGEGLDDYDQETLNEAIESGGLEDWNYDLVLEDLCEKGYVQPGKYLVRMSW